MKTALVTGIGGTRSIAVMNALRMSGEECRIIGTDANYFNAGSFQCDTSYIVPLANDPTYAQKLKKIIADEKVDIVFATVEKEVAALATLKDEFEVETGVRVIVPSVEILDICFDKYRTQQFLKDNGFTYIPSLICKDPQDIQKFVEQQGLPLIRKPLFGYGSKGLSTITNQDELASVDLDEAYVLQKLIPNDDTESFYNTVLNEYTTEVFVNNDKSVAGGIVIKRALHGGETVAGYLVKDEEVISYLSKVASVLGILGPCNFQYRVHDGNVYIFEINPLFSGTTSIRAGLGFNGVHLALKSFVEGKHTTIRQQELRPKYFMRYLQEYFIEPEKLSILRESKVIRNE